MSKLELKKQVTKTLLIKPNSRSSDFVTPHFILGCNGGCASSYCYIRRFGRKFIYINTNTDEILEKIRIHATSLGKKKANQVDDTYWTYDICCDTDLVYHWKDYDWDKVLKFFIETPDIKATFATKYVNYKLAEYGKIANDKLRIRFSLMPQNISDILEPNTSSIIKRIEAVDKFIDAGWNVHLNFSPVIYYDNWLEDYRKLFTYLNLVVRNKDKIKCEVIFLTHNYHLHNLNLEQGNTEVEKLLWKPELQENKVSQYGGDNVRYNYILKAKLIKQFKELHQEIIPWCKIRYIF